jgi:hypothetical protein
MNGISNIAVSNQQPTSLTLSFTLTAANAGARTLTVTTNLTASTTLTIQAGLQVTSFAGVNEPNNDLLFKINGSSFSGVTLVDFTKGGGGTTQVTLGGGNVTPNQLTIPLAQIPSDAVVGPVKVQSNGQTVTSGSNATPPAKVTAFAGSVARGTTLTITGLRFVSPLHIRIVKANVEIVHKSTATGFPNGIQGESMTDTQLVVLIPPATPTGASELRIETDGGVIVGGPLTITL